jgi:hypothetical protein
VPASHGSTYLVTKALGRSVTQNMVVSFASQVDFGRMPAVRAGCPPTCG